MLEEEEGRVPRGGKVCSVKKEKRIDRIFEMRW